MSPLRRLPDFLGSPATQKILARSERCSKKRRGGGGARGQVNDTVANRHTGLFVDHRAERKGTSGRRTVAHNRSGRSISDGGQTASFGEPLVGLLYRQPPALVVALARGVRVVFLSQLSVPTLDVFRGRCLGQVENLQRL